MKTALRSIMDAMEGWAPLSYAYAWDKPGLSIGDPAAEVGKVLVCLTVTREVLAAAKKAGAHLVVSHHPLIMEPLKALRTDEPHTRLCLDFVRAGIACYAAHTNLDVAAGGVNSALAAALGLQRVSPLFPVAQAGMVKLVTFVPDSHVARVRDAVCDAGAGVIGAYTHCSFSASGTGTFLPGDAANPFSGVKGAVNEEAERRFETLVSRARLSAVLKALFAAHPYEEVAYDIVPLENRDAGASLGLRGELPAALTLGRFAEAVRRALGVSHVRVSGTMQRRVRRVAVLGGSGGGEVLAVQGDVDVYVTGDVKYHDALAAQARGLPVIDAGHAGTEQVIVPVIAEFLRGHFPGLKVLCRAEAECFQVVR